uniref:Uncharacterized protein n=1 Tax=Octopus bimaculoides TaxID=37653 RepID=A0A0L8GMG8_OCTBM
MISYHYTLQVHAIPWLIISYSSTSCIMVFQSISILFFFALDSSIEPFVDFALNNHFCM